MSTKLAGLCVGLAVAALTIVVVAAPAPAAAPQPDPTLTNLQAAYNGESNAHARYLAFARQAEREGYGRVASLFRAAARAEEIHAANHARVIRELGGVPIAKVAGPVVGATVENLRAAIEGESYERDTMYPEFIAAARAAGQKGALRSFNYAKTAEAEHAQLYQAALDGLAELAGSASTSYYVCTVCGMTTTNLDFVKCVSCFSPKEKYVAVS